MNLNKFTAKSQEALRNAGEIAASFGNQTIEADHLVAALIQDSEGIVVPVLRKLGVDVDSVRLKVGKIIAGLPSVSGSGIVSPALSPSLGKTLEAALKHAAQLKDEYISTEHMLLAIVDSKESKSRIYLAELAVTMASV